ncbi:MAG: hypothetical protein ABIR71_12625 [Chthoniobacterales bacterium]
MTVSHQLIFSLDANTTQSGVCRGDSAAAVASASFMIAVIAGMQVTLVVNPVAPQGFAMPEFLPWGRRVLTISFVLGIYANLLSLGLSGWIRSRALGIVTSTAAFLSAAVVWTFVHWQ